MKSPKRGGSCHDDSLPYLRELGVQITEKRQAIRFTTNVHECVHRWAPYVQGFQLPSFNLSLSVTVRHIIRPRFSTPLRDAAQF